MCIGALAWSAVDAPRGADGRDELHDLAGIEHLLEHRTGCDIAAGHYLMVQIITTGRPTSWRASFRY